MFLPRALTEASAQEPYKIPWTQFGTLFRTGGFANLPTSAAKVLWEVDIRTEMPKKVKPVKPKMWLMCSVELKDNMAYKLT